METNGESSDRISAVDGLDAIAAARRAVRDQPWPTWLYPTNALLLGAITLTSLLDSSMMASLLILVLGVGVALINYQAGRLMGTPYAVPTSKVFLGFVILAGASTATAVVLRETLSEQGIIACASGAVISYGLGSVVHYRSTRR